jgi:hypothetical protein
MGIAAIARVAALLIIPITAWVVVPLLVVATIAGALNVAALPLLLVATIASVATLPPLLVAIALVPAVAPAVAVSTVAPDARVVTPRGAVASAIVGTPWRIIAVAATIEASASRRAIFPNGETPWLIEAKDLVGGHNLKSC